MKKIFALFLVAAMCLSFIACNKEAPNTGNNTSTPESTTQTESLEKVRAAQLKEILCGGKWIYAFEFDYAKHLPSEMYFFDDGTMNYINDMTEEYNGNTWCFEQYVIDGEIEGNPGGTPAMYQTRIEYSAEHGVYYFNCEGLSIMIVGYSVDGEYILHKDGYPYKKVSENN